MNLKIYSSSCGRKGVTNVGEIFNDYDFQVIKKLTPCNIPKVLPTAYDDTLSYYETLNKLIDKVTELQKAIEDGGFEESILERANQYTDARVGEVQSEMRDSIHDLEAEVSGFEGRMSEEFLDLKTATNLALSRLNTAVSELYATIMNFETDIDNKFVTMYNDLIRYINEEIDARDTVYVIDPVTKRRVPIQTALWSMYNQYMREFAVTATEYDSLGLTASEYDNKRLSAYDYDNNFKEKMAEYFNRIMNPFTGLPATLTEIVMHLVDLHRNSITATEYDALQLTADDYEALDITAYTFDFENRTVFV